MKTIITNDPEEAGRCLKNNGIVVFPTETVYGIGVSARNFHGCNKIYEIKGRPKDNPFIVHVGELSMVDEIGYVIPNLWKVIKRFSPGPITYILPKKDQTVFSSGLSTIGIRIPNLGITNTMLKIADVPVAAPSANISGKPSITRVQDAIEVFEGLVNVILNGGNCEVGLESTVVDVSQNPPVYLRPGSISFEELKEFLPLLERTSQNDVEKNPLSPGLKYKHYAPDCEVVLVKDMMEVETKNTGQIGFHLKKATDFDIMIQNNQEYMRMLYSFFIDCDKKNLKRAFCEYPLNDSKRDALLNRILKASTKN